MFKLTFLCLFVIQILSIQAKSYNEVVQDMEPLFSHLHNTLSTQQSSAHDVERMTIMSVSSHLFQGWLKINREVEGVSTEIKNESRLIVEELGITSHVDKIQYCVADMNTSVAILQNTMQTGADVCRSSASKNVQYVVDMIMRPLYEKQYSTHTAIEQVKPTCNSEDAVKSLICIASNLYKKFDPEIEKMRDELKSEVDKMNDAVKYILLSVDMCNDIAVKKLTERKSIVANFRKCVEQVANNM